MDELLNELKNIMSNYQRTTLLSVVVLICWLCEVSLLCLRVNHVLCHVLPIGLSGVVSVGLGISYMVEEM